MPVAQTPIADELPWPKADRPTLPIGERIKSRRTALGMTMRELAQASSLSAPFISQAERGLTIPSLVSLIALAKALDVDLEYFMTIPNASAMVARADQPRQIKAASPVTYFDLSSDFQDRRMDIVMMRIPPGYSFPVDQRNGEHFRFVVEGELHAMAGDIQTLLKAGDSMHFDARLKHSVSNHSDRDAVLLYVGTPSIFRPKSKG